MVWIRGDQKPTVHMTASEVRVRLLLAGEVDAKWCAAYKDFADQEGVLAEGMSYRTKKVDGTGYETHGVLVVRLPLGVQLAEAHHTLDKAEGLIPRADAVWDRVIGAEQASDFIVQDWWRRRPANAGGAA